MALVVGQNSWVTLAEANEYLTNRIGASSWFSLPNNNETPGDEGQTSKESLLITSYFGLLYDPVYSLSPTLTEIQVKYAQIEFALFLLQSYEEYRKRSEKIASGVEEFTFSKWKETLGPNVKKPQIVDDLLGSLGLSGGTYLQDIVVDND